MILLAIFFRIVVRNRMFFGFPLSAGQYKLNPLYEITWFLLNNFCIHIIDAPRLKAVFSAR